ncbi:hypothetical protein LIP_1876 [Limnochorda pilosa]|uniref:Uncharacterized protein n=1 Tax=Limnochorda pilosa TaxID=1555112 RepID=A0A0K2SLM6_LIMPI|nr:hypothetical protein LIP_1876 [Limnochorda pilosa]
MEPARVAPAFLAALVQRFLTRVAQELWDQLWAQVFQAVAEAEQRWTEAGAGAEERKWAEVRAGPGRAPGPAPRYLSSSRLSLSKRRMRIRKIKNALSSLKSNFIAPAPLPVRVGATSYMPDHRRVLATEAYSPVIAGRAWRSWPPRCRSPRRARSDAMRRSGWTA